MKRVVLLTLGILYIMYARAHDVCADSVRHADSLPDYVLVVDDDYDPVSFHLPDSVFDRIAGHTNFRCNRTELNPKDPFLGELLNTVLPKANESGWMLVGIDLRGAASPEGPYANNVRLSQGRSKALLDLMASRLDSVRVTDTSLTLMAEDYPRLLAMLEAAADPAAPVVRRIIDRHGLDNPCKIKADMKRVDGGAIWTRLLRDYFPALRSARVVLFFRRVDAEKHHVADSITPGSGLPRPDPGLGVIPGARPISPSALPQPLAKRHVLSLSTNLLYDAFYMPQYGMAPMPNVGVEYYPSHGHWTYRAAFMCPYYHRWSDNKFFQIRDYHLEVRRYFDPGPWHTGLYLGAYANATKYGIGLSKKKGWQGEGFGGAIKLGYVLPISHGPLRLDFHIAAGGWHTRYDPYVYGNPITGEEDGDYYYDYTGKKHDFHRRNYHLTWFGPTEIGITLTLDVLFKKIKNF